MSIEIPPKLINILVIAMPCPSGGNADNGKHNVTTLPETIPVRAPNTIINFQLLPPTPDALVFTGFTQQAPVVAGQLSNGAVAVNGKMMILIDGNTKNRAGNGDDMDLVLQFMNTATGEGFPFDPQIQNTPEP